MSTPHFRLRKTAKERLWKALNIIVGVITILNVSTVGALLKPGIAEAAANPSADLDQCANDPAPSPHTNGCATSATDWVNGNLGASKSIYLEGDTVPYRMRFENLPLSSHTVTFEWDTTKSGKHALDFLTTYNRTVADANPCLGVTGCSGPTTFPIPVDGQVSGAGVTQIAGNFTMYGGTITGASAYSYPNGTGFSGDKSAQITLTFTASVANPVLAWGGHISDRHDWGADNSAVAIPGSPYHMRLIDLDGQGGNQDRSLSADAVVFPGSITIVKQATPEGSTSFSFTASPSPLTNFNLVDDGTSANTRAFSNITNFQTYNVSESAPNGWTLDSISCNVSSPNGGSQTVNTPAVSINLKEGENVSCTFANSADTGSIVVHKKYDADGNGTFEGGDSGANTLGFRWQLDGGSDRLMGTTASGVATGNHTVTENSVSNYHVVGWYPTADTQYSCANPKETDASASFTLAKDATQNITFCNAIDGGELTVIKHVVGGTASADDWTMNVSGPTNTSFAGSESGVTTGVQPGSYSVTETGGPSGYTLAYSGDCDENGNVSVGPNESKTCTLTNTRDTGSLTVRKNVDTDGDGDVDLTNTNTWTWDIAGGEQNIATGLSRVLETGSYTINEDLKADYHVTDLTCDGQSFGAVTSGQVNVVKNGDHVCTFTNTRDTGSLTVRKNVDTDGDGDIDVTGSTTWTWDISGGEQNIATGQNRTLVTGNYTINEDMKANFHVTDLTCEGQSLGAVTHATVAVTKDHETVCTFTNTRDTGGLTVIKALDTDGDGDVDVINPPGWTWDLEGGNQNFTMGSTQTVITGSHNVNEDQQTNYHSTGWFCVDSETQAELGSGSGTSLSVDVSTHGATCTFTNARDTGLIDGYKFNDLNGDGNWDEGEPGLDGWTIQLSNGASVVTGAGEWPLGYYKFSLVPTGAYTVNEVEQSDWMNTTPNPVTNVVVTYNQTTSVNFGNFNLFDVTVCKYVDVNGDGSIAGDPLYTAEGGWGMTLNSEAGPMYQTTVEGCATYSDLGPGGYSLNEDSKDGWTKTYPATPGYLFDAVSGQDHDFAFGNFQNVSVQACKVNDLDGNLETTNDQSPIEGWTVFLSVNGQITDEKTTQRDGCYTWTNLGPGVSYDVHEATPEGWTNLTPISHDFGPAQSGGQYSYTFVNFENFDVTVCKYVDVNGDGSLAGDPLYTAEGGWNMTLNQTTKSTVEGCTSFTNVGPGGYLLSEAAKDGWIQTYPESETYAFNGASGQDREFAFGNFQLGKISGYKFEDVNGNGAWDQDEPALNGWTIWLNGQTSAVTGSGDWADGYYEFTGLTAGVYTLSEELQAGWTQTYPQNPDTHSVNVTSGTDSTHKDFGNFENINLSGQKFNDLNGNGVKDQDEPGLSNWTINLDLGANGSVDASTVTDGSGNYAFSNLGPGTYRLREVQQAGWTQTTVNPVDIIASSGTDVSGIDFGNFQNVSVQACKVNDLDGNLETTNDQSPIANWTVHLSVNGQTEDTKQTGENGCSTWTNLGPGVAYDVSETVPAGWTNLTPISHDFGPAQSGGQYSYTFVNFELGKIAGYKFNQQEALLNDWQICLTGGNLQEPWCVMTGAGEWPDGYYEFDGLMAGTYTVTEEDRFGWTQFYPESGNYIVVVTSGTGQSEEPTLYNFGNRLNAFDVDIEKSAPSTVTAGNQMTYTLNWSVSGNIPVENVIVTDTIPANTNFVSADCGTTSGTCTVDSSTSPVKWSLGTRNPGESGSLTMTVQVASPLRDGTLINNTALICGDGELVIDNTLQLLSLNGLANPLTTKCDDDTTTTEVESDFTVDVEKTAAATVVPGTNLTYTITWSVAGNSPIDNLVITDAVPANTTFVSASNGGLHNGANPGIVTWNLGAHLPGDNDSVTMTVHVASPLTNGTVLTNTAVLCGTTLSAQEQSFQRCDEDTTTTTVNSAPSLSIVKSNNATTFISPGTVVEYTVTVTNAASATDTARNVVITDTLPTGFTFAVDGTTTKSFPVGDLAPGQSATVTSLVNVSGSQAAGLYDNVAKAKGDNTDEVSATSRIEVRVPQILGSTSPELTIVKTVNKTTVKPGDVVTYTITVTNVGDGDAVNTVVTDTLPSHLSFVHATGQTITWEIGTLEPGHSRVINVDVRVNSDAVNGSYVNTATARADDAPEVQATAKITVKIPKVLGLATTGVGTIDYLIAALGAVLIGLGIFGLRRKPADSIA